MAQQAAQWQVVETASMQQVQQQQQQSFGQSGGNREPWVLIGSQGNNYDQGKCGLQQAFGNVTVGAQVYGQQSSVNQSPPLGFTLAATNSNPAMMFSQQMPAFPQPPAPWQMNTQQAPPQWCSMGYSQNGGNAMATRVTRLRNSSTEDGLKLSAVVVSISFGSSYDQLFQHVPQQGVEGTYVATYELVGSLGPILNALRGDRASSETPDDIRQLIEEIGTVEPGAVVFNWECCSGCSSECFCSERETKHTREIIPLLLQRGHMVMCSDFSLKALIRQWPVEQLGPNPLVKIGEFGGHMRLEFDRSRVAECPSAQLRNAQELSSDGGCLVKCLPSTIAYTVDTRVTACQQFADAPPYKLDVLTIATEIPGIAIADLPAWQVCEFANKRGAAGHVCLTYPSGGTLLVSAGHWVELMRIEGVTEENLLKTAAANYGTAYSANWSAQLAAAPSIVARAEMNQMFAQQLVQQSAPCNYSKS